MTVKELISILSDFDDENTVLIFDSEEGNIKHISNVPKAGEIMSTLYVLLEV